MILNKFRSDLKVTLPVLSAVLFLGGILFSCNKSSNAFGNKAYIATTHIAYNVAPISISLDGIPLFDSVLQFGSTTGSAINPYDTAISRISEMLVVEHGDTLLFGNQAFQQGRNYSIFIYDTLDRSSANMIIMQDYPISGLPDTMTNVRYMNFSPGIPPIGLFLTNSRDTIRSFPPRYFVGNNPDPSAFYFTSVHIGRYGAIAYADSLTGPHIWKLDSVSISPGINYNIFLQGFTDTTTGDNKFQIKSVQLN